MAENHMNFDDVNFDDMIVPKLSEERWEAGKRYIAALRALDFRPSMALWIFDREDEEFRLYLFSSLVGFKGPTKLYTLLHRAYERNATPAELDPWVVAVIDISAPLYQTISNGLNMSKNVRLLGTDAITGEEVEVSDYAGPGTTAHGPLIYQTDWAYVNPLEEKVPTAQQQWRRFSERVERLAA